MERTVTAINAAKPQERKIRTAAYCRVSSDSADQLHSFSAQEDTIPGLSGIMSVWNLWIYTQTRG